MPSNSNKNYNINTGTWTLPNGGEARKADKKAQAGIMQRLKKMHNDWLDRDNYVFDYFSGCQVQVFIGGIWVSDVTDLQFEVSRPRRPIYGYNSTIYDRVAMGSVRVSGQFSIAFKEMGYLHAILEAYREWDAGYLHDKLGINVKNPVFGQSGHAPAVSARDLISTTTQRVTIEKLFDSWKDLDKTSQTFEDWAEDMEDTLWGNKKTSKRTLISTPVDHPAFNMLIMYGDMSENKFDHTLHSLNGVELMGQAQVVRGDGAPIGETYSFMAQNFDQNIQGMFEFEKNDAGQKTSPVTSGKAADDIATKPSISMESKKTDKVYIHIAWEMSKTPGTSRTMTTTLAPQDIGNTNLSAFSIEDFKAGSRSYTAHLNWFNAIINGKAGDEARKFAFDGFGVPPSEATLSLLSHRIRAWVSMGPQRVYGGLEGEDWGDSGSPETFLFMSTGVIPIGVVTLIQIQEHYFTSLQKSKGPAIMGAENIKEL